MRVIYPSAVRECGKLGCRLPAVATAALRYRERVLWIGGLAPHRDPNFLDLCQAHASSITAPYRWERLDERPHAAPPPAQAETGAA